MKLLERIDLSRLAWHRAARVAPFLAWALALAAVAWIGADLFWRFAAPRPAALPVTALVDPGQAARAIAGRHLMGSGKETGPAAAVASRYTLQAVVTGGQGRPGWAILSADGGPQQGYVEGTEISPGVTLAHVGADFVELGPAGRQTVKLIERSGDGSAAPNTPDSALRPPSAGQPVQPQLNQ
jgi:hypothetical protein